MTNEYDKDMRARRAQKALKRRVTYEIMHMDSVVAQLSSSGDARVLLPLFMPYDLWLDEDDDIDTLVNNMVNFYHWCSSRMLTLDRKYAKEIMNSIGAAQAVTDRDRAEIALSYRCLTLTDVYWVRESGDDVSFSGIDLYDHHLDDALVPLALRGRQMTVTNNEMASDISTRGLYPKAWIRRGDDFILLKDGGTDAVRRELAASRICQCFDFRQVIYTEGMFEDEPVTESRLITSKKYSIVSKMAFDIFAVNNDIDTLSECLRLDPVTYYGMNIIDYMTGNTDRHPENWGFLVDNSTNTAVSLYPLMDFNQCFNSYDNIDGASCQTVIPVRMTQREAAIDAVKHIGLRQVKDIDASLFDDVPEWCDMFFLRLNELKKYL